MNATPVSTDRRVTLKELLEGLLKDGLVDVDEARKLQHEMRYNVGSLHPLTQIARKMWKTPQTPPRLLDMETLCQWMAQWANMEFMHIDPLKVNFSAITDVMSSGYAARFRILPVMVNAQEVVVATAEPFERGWEKEIQHIVRRPIRLVIANPEDIARYQVEFYNLAQSIKGASSKDRAAGGAVSNFEQLVELGKSNRNLDANDQHVVRIVDWLWQYAFDQRASDIHIEPRREMGIVRFRIDGVLHQVYQIPLPVMGAMTSRIKILGRMDVVEKRRPQDGRVKTRTPSGQEVELRLSTLPTAFGEKLVMRIFDPEVLVRDFSELGFSNEDAGQWNEMTHRPNGIVLVTGPTGSGKTTTLYTTLKQLSTPEVNVCTLEDPIEMVEPSFNQVQVQAELDMGFSEGIRALMRQDPDIIMVGEIRDRATADMAIQAALTGHLVLSTLHTNDAPGALMRLADLGVPPYMINATVLGVMAQRLVRILCPACKKARAPTEEEAGQWVQLMLPWRSTLPESFYHPVGCLECRRTGYIGRAGIYEIMLLSEAQKKLLVGKATMEELCAQGYSEGMKPLRVSGARKIAAGLTSLEEVLKVAPPAISS